MSPIGRDEAAQRAATELLDPQYEKESLVDLIYRRVMQFMGDLIDAATGGGTAGGVIAAAVIVLILLSVIILVGWQLRRTSRTKALVTGGVFGEQAMTAAEHRRAAEGLAAEGRWAEAVRERFRAIARDMEERALVSGMPGRTATELAAEAAVSLPAFAAELSAGARSFDDVTYGGVAGSREAYDAMTSLDTRLQQARPALAAVEAAGYGGGAR
ncbi:DUF4129 domain-containing protein [Nonomuraea aridisoli]|uniref:Protein-glutamine gamma-glutamyltransferase-like C-terminal domain-containing protein n=1 Tax=Nonomuraea aridisoli TaxID=2070368 RepID=A0A2W2EEB7_9ACTN|nr:DUF4129 domain-containing protein [Nonomuraea aridisoli]PZG07727.1 hypothetical protein C1J01_40135 [Nonomuraea aridisoli]